MMNLFQEAYEEALVFFINPHCNISHVYQQKTFQFLKVSIMTADGLQVIQIVMTLSDIIWRLFFDIFSAWAPEELNSVAFKNL